MRIVRTPAITLEALVTVYTRRWGTRRLPVLTPPSRTDWYPGVSGNHWFTLATAAGKAPASKLLKSAFFPTEGGGDVATVEGPVAGTVAGTVPSAGADVVAGAAN